MKQKRKNKKPDLKLRYILNMWMFVTFVSITMFMLGAKEIVSVLYLLMAVPFALSADKIFRKFKI